MHTEQRERPRILARAAVGSSRDSLPARTAFQLAQPARQLCLVGHWALLDPWTWPEPQTAPLALRGAYTPQVTNWSAWGFQIKGPQAQTQRMGIVGPTREGSREGGQANGNFLEQKLAWMQDPG